MMTEAMHLRSCGMAVLIGDDVPGTVTSVCITGPSIQYKVAWWDGRTRREEWLCDHEVRDGDPRRIVVGYRRKSAPVTGPPINERG